MGGFAVRCGLMGILIRRKEDPVAGQPVVAAVAAKGRSDRVSQGGRNRSCSLCVETKVTAFPPNTGPTPYEKPSSPGLNMA